MKNYFVFFLAIAYQFLAYSTPSNSLPQIKEDSSNVNFLNSVAEKYIYVNTDSTLIYATQALELAKKINFRKGEGDAFFLITQGNYYSGKYKEAELSANEAYRIFEELDLPVLMAEVLVKIAATKIYRAEYSSAEIDLEKALSIFKKHNSVIGQARTNNAFGNINQKRGNYPLAAEYLYKALQQYQEAEDTGGAADALNNLGIVFELQEEYDRALENYYGAYKVFTEIGDRVGVAIGLHNAGIVLKKTGRLDSALFNFRKAKQVDEETGAVDGISYDEKEMGETFILLNMLDSAKFYLSHSLLLAEELKDPVVIVPGIIGLGNIAILEGDLELAEEQLLKAFKMAQEFNLQNEQKDAANLLHKLSIKLKKYKEALHYHTLYHALKDSIFSLQNVKRLTLAEANFEFEKERAKREYLIELEKAENEIKIAEAVWLRNTSIIAGAIITAIAVYIFFNYRRKKGDNEKLIALNEEIEKQRNELRLQTGELHQLNESLNELNYNLENKVRSRTKDIESKNIELAINNKQLESKNNKLANYAFYNAHKLRAPVASILGLVDLFMNPNVSDDEKEIIINKIRKSTTSLNVVVREIQKILEE